MMICCQRQNERVSLNLRYGIRSFYRCLDTQEEEQECGLENLFRLEYSVGALNYHIC